MTYRTPAPRRSAGKAGAAPTVSTMHGAPRRAAEALDSAPAASRTRSLTRLIGVPAIAAAAVLGIQASTAPEMAAASNPVSTSSVVSSDSADSSVDALQIGTTQANGITSVTLGGRAVAATTTQTDDVSRSATRASLMTLVQDAENLGTGPCSLGSTHSGVTCNQAIAYMVAQMNSKSYAWHNRCLELVSLAYGGVFGGQPTAYSAAMQVKAAGLMQTTTDFKNIPRGAVLWYASAPGQSSQAGHVAISVGGGMAISSDAPNADGSIGVVPISYFVTNWQKVFIGYSMPAM